MSALVGRVKSKLLNPLAIYRFLDAATKSITIDSQLGGIHGLYDLASSLKNLPSGKVTFFTLPTYPRSYVVPTDTANLLWTQPQDSLIFQAFRSDKPVSKALLKNPRSPQLSPAKVAVKVLNGTASIGLQDTVAGALQQEGFRVTHTGTASSQAVTQTVIRYRAGQEADALLLAKRVHGAAVVEEHGVQAAHQPPDPGGRLRLRDHDHHRCHHIPAAGVQLRAEDRHPEHLHLNAMGPTEAAGRAALAAGRAALWLARPAIV